MPSPQIAACPDETLVDVVRADPPDARQSAAFDELMRRHSGRLRAIAHRRTRYLGMMLSNLQCGSVEDLVGEVMGRAVQGFRRGRGAKFGTYLCTILSNVMTTGARRKAELAGVFDGAEEDSRPNEPPDDAIRPGSTAHIVLIEIAEIARKAICSLKEAERKAFVWSVVLDYSHEQLADLYPGKSPAALRKMKERASAGFFEHWQRLGGPKAEELLKALGPAMADRLDPERIRDPKARAAYRAWLTGNLAGAAKAVGLDTEETRRLLLSATHDLYQQATLRGRSRVLAQVLDIGGGETPHDPLLARARRTVAIVRAALGVAPLEAAFTTLGAFVQSRLRSAPDYEAAREALGLQAGEFRKFLADEFDPGARALTRLARHLGTPPAGLLALPRRPLGGPELATRGPGRLDTLKVRERALLWIRPPRRERGR